MPLTGFLKIDDIAGESKRADHEDEIDISGVAWRVSKGKSAKRGRQQSRAKVSNLTCYKQTDASSAYLALACMQGKSFPEVTLSLRKDSGDAHMDYLVITMENVSIANFEMANDGWDDDDEFIAESIALSFEKIKYKYTIQADDHSAGDEHEIEYDIAAGI